MDVYATWWNPPSIIALNQELECLKFAHFHMEHAVFRNCSNGSWQNIADSNPGDKSLNH